MTEDRPRLKRGKANSTTQLSEPQRKLLMWIFIREPEFDSHRERKVWPGVACSSKRFYDDVPTGSQKSSLSTSLKRLEARSLITRHSASQRRGIKIYAKLTALGRREAQRLKDHYGKSERELSDARSGLQKWVSRHLRDLKMVLTAQLHVRENWASYKTNMHLPLSDPAYELSIEQIQTLESFAEKSFELDNDHHLTYLQTQVSRFEKLTNDLRLQNGSFPLEKLAEVLQYTYQCNTHPEYFLCGLEALKERQEQLAFFTDDISEILEKFDLAVDSVPVEVYRYVYIITVNGHPLSQVLESETLDIP